MRTSRVLALVAMLCLAGIVPAPAAAQTCQDALSSQARTLMLTQFWDGYLTGYNLQRLLNGAFGKADTVLNLDGFVNGRRVAIGDTLITYQCRSAPAALLPDAADAALDGFIRDAAHPVADQGTEAARATPLTQLAVTISGRDEPCTDLTRDDDGPDGTRQGAEHVLLGALAGMAHARASAARQERPTGLSGADLVQYARTACLAYKDEAVSLTFIAEVVDRQISRPAKRQP